MLVPILKFGAATALCLFGTVAWRDMDLQIEGPAVVRRLHQP
jgi:hypothetical protein